LSYSVSALADDQKAINAQNRPSTWPEEIEAAPTQSLRVVMESF
jgi:hypothetical protein